MASNGEPVGNSAFASAKKAVERGATTIIATTFSRARAVARPTEDENDGGHLLSNDGGACYDAWSSTIAAFPAKVKAGVGVDLYAMSLGERA